MRLPRSFWQKGEEQFIRRHDGNRVHYTWQGWIWGSEMWKVCRMWRLIPLSKLHKTTLFPNWNLYRRNFSILGEGLPKVLFTNIWVEPTHKYLCIVKQLRWKVKNWWITKHELHGMHLYSLLCLSNLLRQIEQMNHLIQKCLKPTWFLEN